MSDTPAPSKKKYIEYEHHGRKVTVREDLKGKHRNVCLCFACDKHKPEEPERCKIAYAVLQNCVKFGIVSPVWECAEFIPEGKKAKTVTGVTGDAKVM